MTGRSKGAKQLNKNSWSSGACLNCGANIVQQGSGRRKKWCNKKCHDNDPIIKTQKTQTAKRHYWKNRTPSAKWRRETNRQILVAEKLLRGECALHPFYNNGERKYVVPGLEYLFDMDHIDRNDKHKTIAKMMKDPEKQFREEMAKCQMLCVECHRRKTVESRDWVQIVKVLEPEMRVVYDQPTLFDN
jgi:hypothetical protein